jgi:ubiquinone/menaquinone biosynthesis C-methylase UbiE
MPSRNNIQLSDVQAVYSGPECRLWELLMGQQVHIGGMQSSMGLAGAAGIKAGTVGVDLCCCTGAGMRFLVRFCDVGQMHGVDATAAVVETGRTRCEEEGLADRTDFTVADASATGLKSGLADFVWGEDAWCYVIGKPALIAEAARLVKPGGTIAFTDWVEGTPAMSDAEMDRFLKFMKFPDVQTPDGYGQLLTQNGCQVIVKENTQQYAPCIDLYLEMVDRQLTFDALRILGFDAEILGAVAEEMKFMQGLAHQGKVIQGRFVAKKAE